MQPLPLFLRGWALTQSGAAAEGRKFIDLAHWLPLGDDALRAEFARSLAMRGETAASKRERELLLKTCPPASFQAGEAQRLAGIDAYNDGRYLEAARLHELAMLRCLRTYVSFIGTELKLTVALALIIGVLLVRPSGLLGRSVVKRV